MKIPKTSPQFDIHRALFIVSGTQEADFYEAYKGVITKITTFEAKKPEYSDRESFSSRGKGQVYESGDKRDVIKKSLQDEFLKLLKVALKEVGAVSFVHVYIFCPAAVHNVVESALPATLKKKITRTFKGNFHHAALTDILKKISTR